LVDTAIDLTWFLMRFVSSALEDAERDEQPSLISSLPVRIDHALAAFVIMVEAGNRRLCHPFVTFLQVCSPTRDVTI
jgi:hypothetical protein